MEVRTKRISPSACAWSSRSASGYASTKCVFSATVNLTPGERAEIERHHFARFERFVESDLRVRCAEGDGGMADAGCAVFEHPAFGGVDKLQARHPHCDLAAQVGHAGFDYASGLANQRDFTFGLYQP